MDKKLDSVIEREQRDYVVIVKDNNDNFDEEQRLKQLELEKLDKLLEEKKKEVSLKQ